MCVCVCVRACVHLCVHLCLSVTSEISGMDVKVPHSFHRTKELNLPSKLTCATASCSIASGLKEACGSSLRQDLLIDHKCESSQFTSAMIVSHYISGIHHKEAAD